MINKIIWILWFQGWDDAPWLVRKCLASWQVNNPGWDIRVLDATTLQRYIELPDLEGRDVGPAALSDIVRICLLHEYGGVWVDATVQCHRPLDDWLPEAAKDGFFAFSRPGPDRLVSSWFLAARENHPIVMHWHAATLGYWRDRLAPDAYFWFHYLLGTLYDTSPEVRRHWDRVPKISADGPHGMQHAGLLLEDDARIAALMDDLPALSKLTYRYDAALATARSLVTRLLAPLPEPVTPVSSVPGPDRPLASLSVSTLNLGDHIQILAARRLIERVSSPPSIHIDRDNEIGSCPGLDAAGAPYPIVLNGWFKTNAAEWPPNTLLDPVYIGFHIRLHQCPRLLAEDALAHYSAHGPVGCRDTYTYDLLHSHGREVYLSHCLTLSLPKREYAPEQQTEVFVVSRDDRILSWLPPDLAGSRFVSHYVEDADFARNMERARGLLDLYRTRARLIVTSLLHCALPAIAMGIPVVMFYPENSEAGHVSDRERLSSLAALIPIYAAGQTEGVDWAPVPVDVARHKLDLVTRFYSAIAHWRLPVRHQFTGLEPLTRLPPPEEADFPGNMAPAEPEAPQKDPRALIEHAGPASLAQIGLRLMAQARRLFLR